MYFLINIQGLVQGVGFRPFIYHTARRLKINGTVANSNYGVVIRTDCSDSDLQKLINAVKSEHPGVAYIHSVSVKTVNDTEVFDGFKITGSHSSSNEITQVAPDIAVCSDCLKDYRQQQSRISYPFINCTQCGPRFSIIKDLPYDRKQTSMSKFAMCRNCKKEYENIDDRRFHAEPVACNECGPVYYTKHSDKEIKDYKSIITLSSKLIDDGKVITVRGIGGYHLVCDAVSIDAVSKLRQIKHRDNKPFAVMVRNEDCLRKYVKINRHEEELITSWRRPIVLLEQKTALSPGINDNLNTLGCMLPYLPIHYEWFENVKTDVLVMTSGNVSDCPIIISPEEAECRFSKITDLIIHHDRDIINRIDDSIALSVAGNMYVIRRSRGFVPEPLFTDINTEGIVAFGAEKVNTFSIGKGQTIIQSQYMGDLKNAETLEFFEESMARFSQLFRFKPQLVVCDMHPDYLSTFAAEKMSGQNGLPLLTVQHHHAHAVACMIDNDLDEPVIAVVWDGIGLGDDGKAWGGEFFVCDRTGYSRENHLPYIKMPGGDIASKEPWRMAVSLLYHYKMEIPGNMIKRIGMDRIIQITQMIEKNINSPETSSAGRLFDAFSSLPGLCDISTYQAEAPSMLEQSASDDFVSIYKTEENISASVYALLYGVISDMNNEIPVPFISAKIHNTLADIIAVQIRRISKNTGIKKAVVSGGCFQNKRLLTHIINNFSKDDISLYIHSEIPCNDSGIAVGQLAIAASKRKKGI
jgi:hydrogenase maturation protein HypF